MKQSYLAVNQMQSKNTILLIISASSSNLFLCIILLQIEVEKEIHVCAFHPKSVHTGAKLVDFAAWNCIIGKLSEWESLIQKKIHHE